MVNTGFSSNTLRIMLRKVVLLAALASVALADVCHLYSNTIESPCFQSQKNGTDYSIRYYGPAPEFFTNANIPSTVFAEAQNQGFHANFDYISGQNSKNMQIPMTSPVIFRKGKPGWQVGFYVPSKFNDIEDIPEPKNPSVTITPFTGTYAVSVFSGFAQEADFVREEAQLRMTLSKANVQAVTKGEWASVWAGYDSPFVLFNRHNEVWVQLA